MEMLSDYTYPRPKSLQCIYLQSSVLSISFQHPVIDKRLTSVGTSARIHIVEMGKIRNRGFMKEYVGRFSDALYDKVLAIVPTGWTHQVCGNLLYYVVFVSALPGQSLSKHLIPFQLIVHRLPVLPQLCTPCLSALKQA